MKKTTKILGVGSVLGLVLSLTALVGPASAAHVGCGDVITQDTTLDSDVGPCNGDGLIIGADRVILDLGGHRVFGTAGVSGEGLGIVVEDREQVWVTNGVVQHFDTGVAVIGGGNNHVTDIRAIDNVGSVAAGYGDGILLESSNRNLVADNISRRNGPFGGITLFGGSSRNTIQGNLVEDNAVLSSPSGPQQTDGIRLENGAMRNVITENRVYRNGLDGIALFFGSSNNRVLRNDVRENGAHDQIHRQGDGIAVFNEADRNLIEGNHVFDNGANGIFLRGPIVLPTRVVQGARNNRVLDNQTGNNGPIPGPGGFRYDLRDNNPHCDENIWFGNTYLTAFPECTTTGGSGPPVAPAASSASVAAAAPAAPEVGSTSTR